MTFGQTVGGYSLQVVGAFSVAGGVILVLLGLAGVVSGLPLAGLDTGVVLLVYGAFSIGVGLGFWYLGAMLKRGSRKK